MNAHDLFFLFELILKRSLAMNHKKRVVKIEWFYRAERKGFKHNGQIKIKNTFIGSNVQVTLTDTDVLTDGNRRTVDREEHYSTKSDPITQTGQKLMQ